MKYGSITLTFTGSVRDLSASRREVVLEGAREGEGAPPAFTLALSGCTEDELRVLADGFGDQVEVTLQVRGVPRG